MKKQKQTRLAATIIIENQTIATFYFDNWGADTRQKYNISTRPASTFRWHS